MTRERQALFFHEMSHKLLTTNQSLVGESRAKVRGSKLLVETARQNMEESRRLVDQYKSSQTHRKSMEPAE